MVQAQSKRQKNIKSKLMAAICMLLVSSIMMVSSTYAWFTLSTAPEVTGITTAVGANGNLEMALLPMSGDIADITSGTADSMAVQAATKANITWGNLVDLSNEAYGLSKIMLYPAALNVVDGKIGDNILSTPSYGSDGRVAELESESLAGVYQDGGFYETIQTATDTTDIGKTAYGVRAVGNASGMTERQLAYRSALAAANTAASKAQSVASTSLNNNGALLANIAIAKATSDSDSYARADVEALMTIVNELLGYDTTTGTGETAVITHTTGALEYIETAYRQYAIASYLATGPDEGFETKVAELEKAELSTLNVSGDGIEKLTTSISNAESAKSTLEGLLYTDGVANDTASFTWEQISPALYKLADPDAMQVNDIKVSELTTKTEETDTDINGDGKIEAFYPNMEALVDAVLNDGLNLILGTGAGVYADIADQTGDYSAAITIKQISYGGLTVKNLDATMSTKTTVNPVYMTTAADGVPDYTAGEGDSTVAVPISDFYGYIIDLAFRTNVAGSNLLLQQEGVDRIYSDNTSNESTMGGGSYMQFASNSATFSATNVKDLMENLRIVFFNADSKDIIAYARLDAANTQTGTDGSVKMPIMITDDKGVSTGSNVITALEQNVAKQVSVLVYLDGTTVTNADVANAASSMTGSMNLQFASDAALDPMEYSDLRTGAGAGDGSDVDQGGTTPTITAYESTDVTVTGGTAAAYYVESGDEKAVLVVPVAENNGTVTTVTINDTTASAKSYGNYSGYGITVTEKPASLTVAITSAT